MGDLHLVRHGPTEWSRSGRHTSETDLPLLPEGEEAARALRPRLADLAPALVLTSPRQRARRTAELAGFPDAVVDPDLVEWGYGAYEGYTTEEIRRHDAGWTIWSHPVPGGEAETEVGVRLDRVIDRAIRADGDLLVFGHGHALRALAVRWLGLPVRAGHYLALDTATVSTLSYERESPVLLRWNA
ncbi:histidine phosphatase family protein [Nocardioides insulae]|uniref:histidine phosphatase family protein n=1 Tax=Nocardioides insulae TaxID=394734 RepID=UPI0003FE2B8C|nr:histidine phosphatase family protein [Nocardioides insulae]